MVISFEPEPDCFRLLEKNIEFHKCNNVIIKKLALTNKTGEISFFKDKSYSILGSLSKNNLTHFNEKLIVETVDLDSFVLKNLINEVNVIKMNIQGSEGLVIDGARKTINDYYPLIITEFWPYGMRNVGSDPVQFIHTLINIGFEGYELNVASLDIY